MNYFDILLAKKLEDDRDPKVEGLSITENGRYHEDGVVYDPVIVNVPETPLSKLTVTENGTYTAPTDTGYNEVDVNVPLPDNAYMLKEIEDVEIATFNDGSDLPMPKLEVAIEPVQDLHGYDSPWVGGAGKNLIPMTVDGIKSANPSATWNGNSTTINGVTFSIQTDSDGNVIGLNANGTASGDSPSLYLARNVALINGSYVLNGCPNNGSLQSYGIFADYSSGGNIPDYGSGVALSVSNVTLNLRIRIANGYTAFNLVFKPMIRLSTVSDSTFAPYSNICPISGWDEVNTTVEGGQNLYNDGIVWKNNYYINASGTETQSNNYKYTQTFIEVEPSTTYSIQADITAETDLAITVPYYTEAQSFISRDLVASVDVGTHTYKADFTTPSNCKYIRASVSTNTSNIIIYKKNTYTISLGSTRYGGKVDLVSGVLTVDRAIKTFDGSENWIEFINPSVNQLYTTINGVKNEASQINVISDTYKGIALNDRIGNFNTCYSATNAICFNIENTSADEWKAMLQSQNVTVVYKLVTPLTIQLSPTQVKSLVGQNNVWADTGNILDLSYLAKEE